MSQETVIIGTNRIYTLTKSLLKRLNKKRGKVFCYTCGQEFKVGDRLTTKIYQVNKGKHARHEDCAKRVNIL